MMHRKEDYDEGQKALIKFSKLVNRVSFDMKLGINMHVPKVEDGGVDGYLEDKRSQQKISFEWEKCHSKYYKYPFGFKKLGQYERKLNPVTHDSAEIQIIGSKTEDAVVVAYHNVYDKEEIIGRPQPSDRDGVELAPMRFTENFTEYKYEEIYKFLETLRRRFD